jgi:hypothetical protein
MMSVILIMELDFRVGNIQKIPKKAINNVTYFGTTVNKARFIAPTGL